MQIYSKLEVKGNCISIFRFCQTSSGGQNWTYILFPIHILLVIYHFIFFWGEIHIWIVEEICICFGRKYRFGRWKERRSSPYHLKIGLDCFRAQSDQIHCEEILRHHHQPHHNCHCNNHHHYCHRNFHHHLLDWKDDIALGSSLTKEARGAIVKKG